MQVQSLGQEDALEEGMATHSSILAWRIHGQSSLIAIIHAGEKSWTRLKHITLPTSRNHRNIKRKESTLSSIPECHTGQVQTMFRVTPQR